MAHTPASDDAFFEALRGEDPLGVVVRTHIQVEARVNQVLAALTHHPSHLPRNLRYEQQVRLAVALGLKEEILQPLLVLGYIRNEFAHRLDVTLSDDMVKRLWESFSEEIQRLILEVYENIYTALGEKGMPEYNKSDVRIRFLTMAIAIDKYLIVAVEELRNTHHAI